MALPIISPATSGFQGVSITYDASGVNRFLNAAAALEGDRLRRAEVRAVNHVGNKGFTKVKRALVAQTGIQYGHIENAVSRKLAFAGAGIGGLGATMEFVIYGRGSPQSLKYFKPRETRKGVSAAPWNRRQIFEHTFMKGGRFPKRKTAKSLNGHVFVRVANVPGPRQQGAKVDRIATRGKMKNKKVAAIRALFGPSVAEEIAKRQALAAFEVTAAELPARLSHEIGRLLP